MKVYRDEGTGGCIELSISMLDIQNENSPDYFELAWEIKPLLGCKEQICLYINNLYLIIIDNANNQGGYNYNVYGRYVTKHPFLSNLFYMTAALPEIWENGADEYVQQIIPMLKQWVKTIRKARKNHL